MDITQIGLERDTFTTVMAQRKSGKSVLLASLIHYFMTNRNNRCDFAYLFSKTAKLNRKTNHSYSFFDDNAILDPKPEIMETFINNLIRSQTQTQMKYHVLLVFDDIVITKRYEILDYLASAGRHYGITVILSSQITNTCISPTIRSNVDYIFWRKIGANAIRDNIFPFMSSGEFGNAKELIQFTIDNTDDYKFMFYNNNTPSGERMVTVKAQPIPEDYKYSVTRPKPMNQPAHKTNKFRGPGAFRGHGAFIGWGNVGIRPNVNSILRPYSNTF